MRQRRWLELLKDYDVAIQYQPGKANFVADALSRKTTRALNYIITRQPLLLGEMNRMDLEVVIQGSSAIHAAITAQPAIMLEIKLKQKEDPKLQKIREQIEAAPHPDFVVMDDMLKFRGRICVPNDSEIKQQIMGKSHNSKLSIHSGGTKMYLDLNKVFWWMGMKRDVADFVSRCLLCQRIKAVRQKPVGLLQPLPEPKWKWENLTMDFVVGRFPTLTEG